MDEQPAVTLDAFLEGQWKRLPCVWRPATTLALCSRTLTN